MSFETKLVGDRPCGLEVDNSALAARAAAAVKEFYGLEPALTSGSTDCNVPLSMGISAVCRLVPGVLSDPECFTEESHWDGLLECPQYSRPEVWHDRRVPPILLSGHHANIAKWRRKQAIIRTRDRRPDMYEKLDLSSKADKKLLKEIAEEEAAAQAED